MSRENPTVSTLMRVKLPVDEPVEIVDNPLALTD
jgi:hypothetical protein